MYAETDTTKILTLPIRGMTCSGCATTVHQALSGLSGVEDIEVDVSTGQAVLRYDPILVAETKMATAVIEAGYEIDREAPSVSRISVTRKQKFNPWLKPALFGLLGMVGLLAVYLALVSLAEGWNHAVELVLADAWIVAPIMLGFGVQMGLYGYLRNIQSAIRGAGAMAGAGGGTSTVAMAACCAHHVTDVLPLLGLSAAAAFLAEYRIPFMVFGLITNLIGISVMIILIVRAQRHVRQCSLAAQLAAGGCR